MRQWTGYIGTSSLIVFGRVDVYSGWPTFIYAIYGTMVEVSASYTCTRMLVAAVPLLERRIRVGFWRRGWLSNRSNLPPTPLFHLHPPPSSNSTAAPSFLHLTLLFTPVSLSSQYLIMPSSRPVKPLPPGRTAPPPGAGTSAYLAKANVRPLQVSQAINIGRPPKRKILPVAVSSGSSKKCRLAAGVIQQAQPSCILSKLPIESPTTGARLHVRDAVDVIERYITAAALASRVDGATPGYRIAFSRLPSGAVTCTVTLPHRFPVSEAVSEGCPSEDDALQLAAFALCGKLFVAGLLDDDLFPREDVPAWKHTCPKTADRQYTQLDAPFWRNSGVYLKQQTELLLYPVVISAWPSDSSFPSIGLFTKAPSSDIAAMSTLVNGLPCPIKLTRCAPIAVTEAVIRKFHRVSWDICSIISSGSTSRPLDDTAYFLVPLKSGFVVPASEPLHLPCFDINEAVDWSCMKDFNRKELAANITANAVRAPGQLMRAVIVEDGNHGARYALPGTMRFSDLSHDTRRSLSRRSGPGIRLDSPVLRLTPLLQPGKPKYVMAFRSRYHPAVSISLFSVLRILPMVMDHYDHHLAIRYARVSLFDGLIGESGTQVSVTAPKEGVVRHGMDYERNEYHGDTRLKLSVSAHTVYDAYRRGVASSTNAPLEKARRTIVSNKSLLRGALRCGLPGLIATPQSSSSLAVTLSLSERRARRLADKSIADVVEALLEAANSSGGRYALLRVATRLGLPSCPDALQLQLPPLQLLLENLSNRETIWHLQERIGPITRYDLVSQVLPSGMTGWQMLLISRHWLRWLGDAVLDDLVVEFTVKHYKHLGPGQLTKLKGAMIAEKALAAMLVHSGLCQHFVCSSKAAKASMEAYAQAMNTAQKAEDERSGKRGRAPGDYWKWTDLEVPKELKVTKVILGALYISENFTMKAVKPFFGSVMAPFYMVYTTPESIFTEPFREPSVMLGDFWQK
ncbi:hypothetical protein BOTBODRAFT_238674 [Botryobasidium botryosum FD-172 SS1]|uniref:Uncharacterized protein n=1 Tax=Botryobasidium botryosum (strain FD-172 SS1) TaxID=930990 RepID=A0A067MMD5_BOTB1|nr:hypothetical protein BOTBODRAFT_238674 [Botryobasidium botryosum FD-172 SS1]